MRIVCQRVANTKKRVNAIAKTKKEIQKAYEQRTNYAAQKKYDSEKVVKVMIRLNKDIDKDILIALDESKPLATQIKELARKGLQK